MPLAPPVDEHPSPNPTPPATLPQTVDALAHWFEVLEGTGTPSHDQLSALALDPFEVLSEDEKAAGEVSWQRGWNG